MAAVVMEVATEVADDTNSAAPIVDKDMKRSPEQALCQSDLCGYARTQETALLACRIFGVCFVDAQSFVNP